MIESPKHLSSLFLVCLRRTRPIKAEMSMPLGRDGGEHNAQVFAPGRVMRDTSCRSPFRPLQMSLSSETDRQASPLSSVLHLTFTHFCQTGIYE